MMKKLFNHGGLISWNTIDMETVDEIIFKASNERNRLILELMARGGMRIGEVLKLTPNDIHEKKLTHRTPKIGKDRYGRSTPNIIEGRRQILLSLPSI